MKRELSKNIRIMSKGRKSQDDELYQIWYDFSINKDNTHNGLQYIKYV